MAQVPGSTPPASSEPAEQQQHRQAAQRRHALGNWGGRRCRLCRSSVGGGDVIECWARMPPRSGLAEPAATAPAPPPRSASVMVAAEAWAEPRCRTSLGAIVFSDSSSPLSRLA